MFSKLQVNHKTIWHNSNMNDNQLNNNKVMQTYTQLSHSSQKRYHVAFKVCFLLAEVCVCVCVFGWASGYAGNLKLSQVHPPVTVT